MKQGRRSLLFTLILSRSLLLAQSIDPNPFATQAKFSVDSESVTSTTVPDLLRKPPELLHPRLALCSVAGTTEPDSADPKHSLVKLTFYGFPFTPADRAAARRGNIEYLEKKFHAIQSTNLKSADFNGGGWTSVQLTVDERFQLQQVFINVPGYGVLLHDRDLNNFAQEYRFDGKKLRLKSKGLHRLDLSSAGVPSFTLYWDIDLTTLVASKAIPKK